MQNQQPFLRLFPLPYIEYDIKQYLLPSKSARDFFTPNFYRCLPMVAANTLGWTLYNPFEFEVVWQGGGGRDGVIVETDHPEWAHTWFGEGTFTIFPQFLLQTSPGINILIRPVPNHLKLPVLTLDGIVETDWLKTSFTLNFKMMLPLLKAHYEVGEPLVQLVPYGRTYIEEFEADIVTEGEEYEARVAPFARWQLDRKELIDEKLPPDLHYMRGRDLDGSKVPEHKKTFKVPPFK